MNLISDDRGVAFGLFLFLAIIVIALLMNAMINSIYEPSNAAFDDNYRNAYLTQEGRNALDMIDLLIGGAAFTLILFAAAIMVINRAILKGEV